MRENWVWYGHAGHLCVADSCRFHLTTRAGNYLISTVGDYYCPALNGGSKRLEIGHNRFFETMVFRAGEPCAEPECDCGMPMPASWSELECQGYQTAGEAAQGHIEMCEKWEAKDGAR